MRYTDGERIYFVEHNFFDNEWNIFLSKDWWKRKTVKVSRTRGYLVGESGKGRKKSR